MLVLQTGDQALYQAYSRGEQAILQAVATEARSPHSSWNQKYHIAADQLIACGNSKSVYMYVDHTLRKFASLQVRQKHTYYVLRTSATVFCFLELVDSFICLIGICFASSRLTSHQVFIRMGKDFEDVKRLSDKRCSNMKYGPDLT